MFISTISIAEYCVKGSIDELPFRNVQVISFNIDHAKEAGKFGKIAFNARKNRELEINERPQVLNDAKLFAQANIDIKVNKYISSDSESEKIYNKILEIEGKLNFTFINLNISVGKIYGLIDF